MLKNVGNSAVLVPNMWWWWWWQNENCWVD